MAVYQEPTPWFNPLIEVAALFIEKEDKILLLHRHEHKSQGNKWGIPGGKIEKGETPLQAALRETLEETGYDFSGHPVDHLHTVYIEYTPTNHFIYHMFRVQPSQTGDVKINPAEHKAHLWTTPQESLAMQLIDDEDTCIKMIYDTKCVTLSCFSDKRKEPPLS